MKTFTPKFFLSLFATTAIAAGIAYAAGTITSTSQTVTPGATMDTAWFNEVNTKLNTPDWTAVWTSGTAPSNGMILATSWHDYGIVGTVNGVVRFTISGRDKYGQGRVSNSMPVRAWDTWSLSFPPSTDASGVDHGDIWFIGM